ncbi:Uncharacterised protein [Nocardia otitidiscaviarum]|uniref:Uncharacterized protein n=1 Tax=Nocardia otitidiscaviarum TaxID=1823 RepID=A0A378YKC5_9NOCA|nr:Uncharacterised protein [Nocardia otitidiscaviarum]
MSWDLVLTFLWVFPLSFALTMLTVGLCMTVVVKAHGYPLRSLLDVFRRQSPSPGCRGDIGPYA